MQIISMDLKSSSFLTDVYWMENSLPVAILFVVLESFDEISNAKRMFMLRLSSDKSWDLEQLMLKALNQYMESFLIQFRCLFMAYQTIVWKLLVSLMKELFWFSIKIIISWIMKTIFFPCYFNGSTFQSNLNKISSRRLHNHNSTSAGYANVFPCKNVWSKKFIQRFHSEKSLQGERR